MRTLVLTLLLLVGGFAKDREVVITRKVITVSGQTSIGGFNCDFKQSGTRDTLSLDNTKSQRDLVFDIPVQDFSCGNFLINRDFRKTIKADQFPHAKVRVRNLKANYGHYTCDMTVQIVGKKLEYKDLILNRVANGVTAKLILSFEELELEAPKKMGGLIKVEEALHLEFLLGF
jgi:hypothetical protein